MTICSNNDVYIFNSKLDEDLRVRKVTAAHTWHTCRLCNSHQQY